MLVNKLQSDFTAVNDSAVHQLPVQSPYLFKQILQLIANVQTQDREESDISSGHHVEMEASALQNQMWTVAPAKALNIL